MMTLTVGTAFSVEEVSPTGVWAPGFAATGCGAPAGGAVTMGFMPGRHFFHLLGPAIGCGSPTLGTAAATTGWSGLAVSLTGCSGSASGSAVTPTGGGTSGVACGLVAPGSLPFARGESPVGTA